MKWAELVVAGLTAGACLVVAPLDAVHESSQATPDASDSETSAGGETGTPDSGGCTENRQCVDRNGNLPYRCFEGRCVPLTTPECPLARGRFEHKNAVFIAAFTFMPPVDQGANDTTKNYQLALDELNGDTVGGLFGPDGEKRPIALVLCDNGSNLELGARRALVLKATQHVVEDVRVPGIIAMLDSGDLLEAFDQFGKPNGVFFLTPIGSTQALAEYPDNGLLWHMLGQPGDLAASYAALLEAYEKYFRAPQPINLTGALKVALVYTQGDAFDEELKKAAGPLLKANGKLLTDQGNSANYREVVLSRSSGAADFETAGKNIASFAPHIVISLTGDAFSRFGDDMNPTSDPPGVLKKIETNWLLAGAAPRPRYILSPLNADYVQADVFRLIQEYLFNLTPPETTAATRFTGINVAGSEDAALYNEYLRRIHPSAPTSEGDENFYDALYFLAYGIQATRLPGEATGSDIAQSFGRLIKGGEEFNVGPSQALAVLDVLSKPDRDIRLNGTLGPPRFDRATGTRVDTGAVYCIEKLQFTLQLHYQVGYYDADRLPPLLKISKRFEGVQIPCLSQLGLPPP